ncbi:hypothetical protein AQI88_04140 [Streptomyces cellostaticus]|uniref:Pectate lyase domain-containing protein n=1 Tax=Streptomyces cellostaticus TaxID=67285 RepID=A0A117PYA1_9ACTN|nr:hypothetical protein AQI88_04140 [Streptomyces cellostaticus]GHI08650.1 hypothetical protein Scel_69710 [Streptomyces cellostaticus]
MTHFPSKRLPLPGAGLVLAAVTGLIAALGLGAVGQAKAATDSVASPWSDRPHGFASLTGGTTGGAGGKVVTVTDQAALAMYAAAKEPYVIRVAGSIAVAPFGSDIVVGSDKTIIGVGDTGEIVHGELRLNPGTHNVIIRVQHPYQADGTAELVQRGSVLRNTAGRTDEHGTAFDPRAFYAYRLDPAAAVPALVERFSGPQARIGR